MVILSQMTKERIHAFLTAVGIATAITVIMTSTIITQVFAIKYFFNCMTDSANRHGKLALDDIHKCLYKKYSVNRKLPYGTFFHSFRGGGENSDGH
jgi:hypothetical protein